MEPATIIAITSAAVKLLSPYLEEAAKGFAKKSGEEAGSSAFAKARQIYDAIHAKFHGTPAHTSLEDLQASPGDADTQAALRVQLKKVLETDSSFANQISELLKDAHAAGADAVFNTNIQGDVDKLTNIAAVYGNVSF